MSKKQAEGRVGNNDREDNGVQTKTRLGDMGNRTNRIKKEPQRNDSIFTHAH